MDHGQTAVQPAGAKLPLETENWDRSGWRILLAPGLIVLAGLAAYANSFSGAFIYDDSPSIIDNPSIHQLWPIGQVLSPPRNGETVSGRPLLNLSLAIDYAIGGTNTSGYHVTNLAIHLLNGLLLLGILRRTFCLPVLRPRLGDAAWGLAMAVALLWVLHPLQTESVTYIVQRAESLAATSYLLVFYSVIRGMKSPRRALWYTLAVLTCFLGVATKETVATVPLLVLLYDRTLVSGRFRESLRRRWGLYLGLMASWGLLLGLMGSTRLVIRQGELGAPDPWAYARSQPGVILHYLRLSLWPHPLCFSYDWPVADTLGEILPGLLVLGVLLAATLWGLWKRREWALVGAWFFLILAPTSSIMPLRQLAFEHRMYLPLAAVLMALAMGGYLGIQALVRRTRLSSRAGMVAAVCVVALVAIAMGILTHRRNETYRSAVSIWEDTVTKAPHNPWAHLNVGVALSDLNRLKEAIEHDEQAIRLKPDFADAYSNLGFLLDLSGRAPEAIQQLERALSLDPDSAGAHNNYGRALVSLGRIDEAMGHYQQALRIRPEFAEAYYNLGYAFLAKGQYLEAVDNFEKSLRIKPGFAEAHNNLAGTLVSLGRLPEAMDEYQQAIRLKADYPEPHHNLGNVLVHLGRADEAIEHYKRAVQIKPGLFDAQFRLMASLVQAGRFREAIEHGREAVHMMPNHAQFHQLFAWLIAAHEPADGVDPKEAVQLAERACDLTGRRDSGCLDTLAVAYAADGRFDEAIATAKEAWRLAQAAGQDSWAEEIHVRIQLYRDHKPYREPRKSI